MRDPSKIDVPDGFSIGSTGFRNDGLNLADRARFAGSGRHRLDGGD